MKTIFYNANPAKIDEVYPQSVIDALRRESDIDLRVYSKADILAGDGRFADVECLFSTWELEPMTEEEIAAYKDYTNAQYLERAYDAVVRIDKVITSLKKA